MDGTWTITELADRATAALTADGAGGTGDSGRVNGRVRDLPNERLIRWYTTIGLVDPPLGRRGRTALYGPRHLLQLVAVKRRQAAGRTIAEIQTELAGATDSALTEIARIPGPSPDDAANAPADAPSRGRFWLARTARPDDSDGVTDGDGNGVVAKTERTRPAVVQGVRLATGLTLLLDVPALDGDDLAAIENAARPLVDELARRGLIGSIDTPGRSS